MQEHLLYLTELILRRDLQPTNKLRGVSAFWREKDHTACMTFYFDGSITDEDLEEINDLSGRIMAHIPDGLLEENYIRWDYPKPLPNEFLVDLKNSA